MDEVKKLKQRYAQQIEDGRKIEVFTSMPEWQWYIEHVIKPTLDDYTNRIMTGVIQSDKEDWILRGMMMGIKLVIDTPDQFKQVSGSAKTKAKALQEYVDES
jgi:hypothetical protein